MEPIIKQRTGHHVGRRGLEIQIRAWGLVRISRLPQWLGEDEPKSVAVGNSSSRHLISKVLNTCVQLRDKARLRIAIINDDPTLPLAIVVQDSPGVSDTKESQKKFGFLAKRFRLLIYDLRGSGGRSDDMGPFTHQRWLVDIEELSRWAGNYLHFTLVGDGYCGCIALQYAIAYSRRLSALILHDTWVHGVHASMGNLKTVLTYQGKGPKPDVDRQLRLWSGFCVDEEDFAAAVSEIRHIYKPHIALAPRLLHHETHNFAYSMNMPYYDLRSWLRQIRTPTLAMANKANVMNPVEAGIGFKEDIAHAQLVICEDTGHVTARGTLQSAAWAFLANIAGPEPPPPPPPPPVPESAPANGMPQPSEQPRETITIDDHEDEESSAQDESEPASDDE
ncbi:alpha beta hydrolase fold protein [Emericellopsis cladophorae]|uniref:Alpha beta hydrolase fold protein n=1 Tax=Emericellopsis cladophorae TaxID=2686198 RepID=A0A9Q0BH61_9HYPO|nr:alpha beta hydrolase fold protein [Emericellopsis cladophorae]KAI6784716.1 alpha beta hydrolase fold protein [Emericellopsis cladophorae]